MPVSRISSSPAKLRQWLRAQGYSLVAGVDEAGRGALAGPLVAAAVILPANNLLPGIRDSKKFTSKQRDAWYETITHKARRWAVASVSAAEIDRVGIQQANVKALEDAAKALSLMPDCVVCDWYENPAWDGPWHAIIHGEMSHPAIAAASIIAKVTRDRIMIELHETYPEYDFAGHKGYGSACHLEALRVHGPCLIHRSSYAPCRKS
jgi:ribonuclease HII